MRLISIDVGIKNLAFCLLEIIPNDSSQFKIIKWDIINVGEEETLICQHLNCNKPSKFQKNNTCFCLKHAKNGSFKIPPPELKISYINKQKVNKLFEIADKYCVKYEKPIKKVDLVSLLHTYIKTIYFEPIINIDASKIDLITIGRNIHTKMDSIFYSLNSNDINDQITHVIIENQISPIANRMKTIQGMIAQYFIMKNVKTIEFISAFNKLKNDVNTHNSDDEIILNTSTYNNRKKTGIRVCLELLQKTNSTMLSHFESHKKKDDLADSLLQGMWYITNKLYPKS